MFRARLLCAVGAVAAGITVLAPVTTGPTASAAPPAKLSCGGERPAKPTGGRYTCTFEEEFDGSSLDRTKWIVQDTSLSGFHAGQSGCYVDDPDNISVGSGELRLTSRREAEPFVCRSPYGDYTTDRTAATVATYGRFAQAYGRFEFRAKLPAATIQGIHSALWLYPQKHTYGAWPASGEIDVAEWFSGAPANVYPSVHYEGEVPMRSTGYTCPVADSGTQFHRYAVEWTPSSMRFLYDGQVCWTHSWLEASPLPGSAPFDQPFYVVLTQVFGGGWNAVTAETPDSATLSVDWVRVWR